MSFKEGDIVEAAQDIGIVHLVPKGTVGIVTRRALPRHMWTVEFFRPDGHISRTIQVLGGEIKKCDPAKKTSFVTKEEFLLHTTRMETSISSLQNKIKALEAKAEKEETEPLLKVGDVVEIPKDILLGFRETVKRGQKLEVLAVDKVTSEVVVYAEVSSLPDKGYFYRRIITLSQDRVKKVEEPLHEPTFCENEDVDTHPLARKSLKALSALHNDTLALMSDALLLGKGREWRKKVDMVGDMIKQLKKAFSNS